MVLDNKILWNNEMSLAICLNTELEEDEFENESVKSHLELTGEVLEKDEYFIVNESIIRVLEVV